VAHRKEHNATDRVIRFNEDTIATSAPAAQEILVPHHHRMDRHLRRALDHAECVLAGIQRRHRHLRLTLVAPVETGPSALQF